jgi:hypothetical protein
MLNQDMNGKCGKRTLATNGPFNVQMCDCGAVHLTLGFVTVRLDPSAYRELAGVVTHSLVALPHPTARTLN